MTRPQTLLLTSTMALVAFVAALPAAAQVYKVVAPDGHVTYSDQKPAEVQGQATVIGSAGSQRPLNPAASAPSRTPGMMLPFATEADAAAKRAVASAGRSASGVVSTASTDSYLLDSLIAVKGYEDLVQTYRDFCASAMPTSTVRFDAAANAWRRINGQITTQVHNLQRNLLTAQQQAVIEAAARARADIALFQVKEATTNGQVRWCDRSSDDLHAGMLDLANKAVVSRGLARYITQLGP